MPLASAAELAPAVGSAGPDLQTRLHALRDAGWLESVSRGMLLPRQERWFLTRHAVELIYDGGHAQGSFPGESAVSPFEPESANGRLGGVRGQPPWTATARGVRTCLRRLAALELIYGLAPVLVRDGLVIRSPVPERKPAEANGSGGCCNGADECADERWSMTDFRLLRRSGFYHAVAHFRGGLWVTFTYVGVHASERVIRRKHEHRFWGLDCYSSSEDRFFHISNRNFYESPDQVVKPSAQVIVAADDLAAELVRGALRTDVPTLICNPSGACTDPVRARRSRDRISDPVSEPNVGRPEVLRRWWRRNLDLDAIRGPAEFWLFMTIAEFPAMRVRWLGDVAVSSSRMTRWALAMTLDRFVETALVAEFDGRYYLAESGIRRAANLSRVLPEIIRRRHAAYHAAGFRRQEQWHNDGVNRLAQAIAREGSTPFGGWRAELNLQNITQVKPDMVLLVTEGPFGPGRYCVEYERSAVAPSDVQRKLAVYRKCAAAGRPQPLLVVTDTERAAFNFAEIGSELPLMSVSLEAALDGPMTGDPNVWRLDGDPVPLHCR